MSVNGIEIKAGQKWRTRGGDTVFVTDVRADLPEYPVQVLNRGNRTADGFAWDDGEPDDEDLIELIEDNPPLPAPAADDEGWIEWAGGECPVPAGTKVQCRYRNGDTGQLYRAEGYRWNHAGNGVDIVAYRVIKAAPKAAPSADEGWINWGGDARPVPVGAKVEWRTRNGKTGVCFATTLSWKVMGNDNDIVAYRVIEAAPKAEQPDADTLASETLQALGWHFNGQAWVQDAPAAPTSALDVQEGGNHYKSLGIQPVEYIEKNQLDYFQGNVIKYITRHKAKNGAEDVKKAAHYCQLILELQYGKVGAQ